MLVDTVLLLLVGVGSYRVAVAGYWLLLYFQPSLAVILAPAETSNRRNISFIVLIILDHKPH